MPELVKDRKRRVRVGRGINVWIAPEIGDDLDRYLAELRPRVSLTAFLENLIERELLARGARSLGSPLGSPETRANSREPNKE